MDYSQISSMPHVYIPGTSWWIWVESTKYFNQESLSEEVMFCFILFTQTSIILAGHPFSHDMHLFQFVFGRSNLYPIHSSW